MARIRMPYGRDKIGIGMPLREKRVEEGEWRGLNPEYPSSHSQPVFSLTAGVLTRTLWTAGRGGQAACSLTTNDSSSRTHPADSPAPVCHSVDSTGYQLKRA